MKKFVIVLLCLFLVFFVSSGPAIFGASYVPAPKDSPVKNSPDEETTSVENKEKPTNIDFDECDNCCSNDESFLELVKKVSLLEKEISKLRLELEKNKAYNEELDIESESKVEERKGITGFFMKIFR